MLKTVKTKKQNQKKPPKTPRTKQNLKKKPKKQKNKIILHCNVLFQIKPTNSDQNRIVTYLLSKVNSNMNVYHVIRNIVCFLSVFFVSKLKTVPLSTYFAYESYLFICGASSSKMSLEVYSNRILSNFYTLNSCFVFLSITCRQVNL